MNLGKQICFYRKKAGLSQAELAEIMDVSFQTVSGWERDAYSPDVERLTGLAEALRTTVERLLAETPPPAWELRQRFFDENHMYTFLKSTAQAKRLLQTSAALPYAKARHAGQFRRGKGDAVPYISHPLTMACQALAMGLNQDALLAALLLHDTVEDCGVQAEDLPVGAEVKEAVLLVSFDVSRMTKEAYYTGIQQNALACLVKCIDRVNNLSGISMTFSRERMARYVTETETYIVPLLDIVRAVSPEWNNAAWLLRYQMLALLETYKRLL